MKKIILFSIAIIIFQFVQAQKDSTLVYSFNKENVVASRLEGVWKSEHDFTIITFRIDSTVIHSIPKKYYKFLKQKTIYLAGIFSMKEDMYTYILTEHNGNPHLVYFEEKNGDPMGDAESFNLFIASAEAKASDLLYIGGDFNNEPFKAYRRVK